MSCIYKYKNKIYTESQIKDLILERDILKNHPIVTFIKKLFKTLPFQYKENLLNEGSKKYGIERGESTATIKYSLADQNKVEYGLKAIEILHSDKAIQIFEKGKKNNWSLDKILTELQIPKEQKQLLLDLGITDREQLALELVSKYSYTVEINTAKESGNIEQFEDEFGNTFSSETSIKKDSSYYSNLTVPGGTNYTERNFETPLIKVPKSHAQFNTENTIGFTRGDDRQVYTEKDIDSLLEIMQKSGILKVKC